MASATNTQRAPNTLSGLVDRGGLVKLSFFGLPSIHRLARQRAEAKDHIDIDAILRDGRIALPVALAAGQAIYGQQFNPQITLKALSFFEDGNLRRLPRAAQDRLAKAARDVYLDRLPTVAPLARHDRNDAGSSR